VKAITEERRGVLLAAFAAHPERFVHGIPQPPVVPEAAWINKPKVESREMTPDEKSLIPGIVGYGLGGDRRSSGILEGDYSIQPPQPPGNDIKFESAVSHYH
jgi:hypothetical protein